MSKVYLVVTAVGHDRRGTVEKITDVVVEHHANIEESKIASTFFTTVNCKVFGPYHRVVQGLNRIAETSEF